VVQKMSLKSFRHAWGIEYEGLIGHPFGGLVWQTCMVFFALVGPLLLVGYDGLYRLGHSAPGALAMWFIVGLFCLAGMFPVAGLYWLIALACLLSKHRGVRR
jgi:hypothetical protein